MYKRAFDGIMLQYALRILQGVIGNRSNLNGILEERSKQRVILIKHHWQTELLRKQLQANACVAAWAVIIIIFHVLSVYTIFQPFYMSMVSNIRLLNIKLINRERS